jgi:hypothetical protein
MTTHLLLNEKPLMVLPSLAKLLGINASIAVQHIHWIIEIKHENQDDRTDYDGFTWCKYSLNQWQSKMVWMSIDGIQKMLTKLEADGAIISCKPDAKSRNQTKWYRVNIDGLNRLSTKSISDSVQNPILDSVQNERSNSVQNDLYQKDIKDLNKDKILFFDQNLSDQNKTEDIPIPPLAPPPPSPIFVDPMGDRFRDAGKRIKQVDAWLKDGEFLKFMHKLIKRTEYYKTSTNITDAKDYIRKAKIQGQDKAVFYESLCDHYQDFLDSQHQRSQQQPAPIAVQELTATAPPAHIRERFKTA